MKIFSWTDDALTLYLLVPVTWISINVIIPNGVYLVTWTHIKFQLNIFICRVSFLQKVFKHTHSCWTFSLWENIVMSKCSQSITFVVDSFFSLQPIITAIITSIAARIRKTIIFCFVSSFSLHLKYICNYLFIKHSLLKEDESFWDQLRSYTRENKQKYFFI